MKKFLALFVIALMTSLLFAKSIRVKVGGEYVDVDIPDDFAGLIEGNLSQIEEALEREGVSKDDLLNAVDDFNDVYKDLVNDFGTATPVGDVTKGLDKFSGDLADAIANAQLMQNVWAEAWLGKLVPGFHIGAGLDVGASQMKITALKDTAKALGMDGLSGLPDSFAFPTVAGDVRLGGIVLPFDFGVSFMTIDSSRISKLDDLLSSIGDGMKFDFLTLGFDFRYALLQGDRGLPKISLGAGYVFTRGNLDFASDEASANLNFKKHTVYLQAQISKKLLFFIPYFGARVAYTKSEINWSASANWENILPGGSDVGSGEGEFGLSDLQSWGILPTEFAGGYQGYKIIPQVYGGFCLDFFIFNLTLGAGWDLVDRLGSAAVSVRLAW